MFTIHFLPHFSRSTLLRKNIASQRITHVQLPITNTTMQGRNFALNPKQGLKIHPFKDAHTPHAQSDRELNKLARYMVYIAVSSGGFENFNHKVGFVLKQTPSWNSASVCCVLTIMRMCHWLRDLCWRACYCLGLEEGCTRATPSLLKTRSGRRICFMIRQHYWLSFFATQASSTSIISLSPLSSFPADLLWFNYPHIVSVYLLSQ